MANSSGFILISSICTFLFMSGGVIDTKGFELTAKIVPAKAPLTAGQGLINYNDDGPYDAFISYRRTASRHLAMLINVLLRHENISSFLDVEDLDGGPWDEQLKQRLGESPNFIIILSKGTLDRCVGDVNYTDVLHQEIRQAVNTNRRIIPVFDEYDFPPTGNFSQEIQTIMRYQGVTWQSGLPDASLIHLIDYMTNKNATNTSSAPAPGAWNSINGTTSTGATFTPINK